MKAIVIGQGEHGDVRLDLAALAEQRLLVQGTSGSGKSGLLRRLLEQSYGLIPQIVIDTEGEFATLRTRFPDYVLAAHEGGDTLAAPHTAAKLARELNALNLSAILDISELDPRPRLEFVANYVTALINLPRAFWKPVMLVVDEAHEFAPENGSAVSLLPIERAASKGRKRGVILVCATTRVADLSKSVTAILNNKLIGKTQQDLDVRRAAFELGVPPREATAMLRDLKSRNFVGFGGAFRGGGLVDGGNFTLYVADTVTHPPRMGEIVAPKAPTSRMRSALAKLADLPKEAEREIRDLADAKATIARLEREAKLAARAGAAPCDHGPRLAELERTNAVLQRQTDAAQAHAEAVRDAEGALRGAVVLARDTLQGALTGIKSPGRPVKIAPRAPRDVPFGPQHPEPLDPPPARERAYPPDMDAIARMTRRDVARADALRNGHDPAAAADLRAGAVKMLNVIATRHPSTWTRAQVGSLSKFRHTGGTFKAYLGDLKRAGFVDEQDGLLSATEAGLARASVTPVETPQTHDAMMAMWRGALRAGAFRLLEIVIEVRDGITRPDAGESSGFVHTGGTFKAYLGDLKRARLVEERDGLIVPNGILWPERMA